MQFASSLHLFPYLCTSHLLCMEFETVLHSWMGIFFFEVWYAISLYIQCKSKNYFPPCLESFKSALNWNFFNLNSLLELLITAQTWVWHAPKFQRPKKTYVPCREHIRTWFKFCKNTFSQKEILYTDLIEGYKCAYSTVIVEGCNPCMLMFIYTYKQSRSKMCYSNGVINIVEFQNNST